MSRRRSARGRRRRSTAEVNLAPMIDMVFILLVFFLVSTTFQRDRAFEVEKAEATSAQEIASPPKRVLINQEGRIFFAGEPVDLASLPARLGVATNEPARDGGPSLLIVPDRRVPAGRLIELMDALDRAGFRSLGIAAQDAVGGEVR